MVSSQGLGIRHQAPPRCLYVSSPCATAPYSSRTPGKTRRARRSYLVLFAANSDRTIVCPIFAANRTGNALPICFATLSSPPTNLYEIGNVCSRAASVAVSGLGLEGWPNRPLEAFVQPLVIVEDGSS